MKQTALLRARDCLRDLGVVAMLTAALAGQQTFMLPAGFALDEGDSEVFESQPFTGANTRYQFVDGGQRGTARGNIKKLEMRRRPTEVAGRYTTRGTGLTVLLAHTNAGALSTTFAANYKGGSATQVLLSVWLLPDFGAGPLPAPAPWSIAIPFSTPFSYNGVDDLLVEIRCQGTSSQDQAYPLDCVRAAALPSGYAWNNGQRSCVTLNGSFLIAAGPGLPSISGGVATLGQYALGGPASAAAVLLLGAGQVASDFGGLVCAPIQPTFDVSIATTTNAVGGIATAAAPFALSFPAPSVPLTLFTQFAALDANVAAPLKVALSDDIKWRIGSLGPHAVTRISATSTVLLPGAIVSGTIATSHVPVMRMTY